MRTEEALLWLNDLVGEQVDVHLIATGRLGQSIITQVRGELQHWTSDPDLFPDDDEGGYAGRYLVGGVELDLTDLDSFGDGPGFLNVHLAEGVRLMVMRAPSTFQPKE
jgi:hemolysin activation/secretion protein